MNPQDQWLQQKEKTLAWVRVGFSVAAVLVIQLNPDRVARFPVLSHLALIGFFAYSLLVCYLIVKRDTAGLARLALLTTCLDLAWVSVIVFSTGPSPTPFFVYYFFPVVTASSRYGIKGGVCVAAIGLALYGFIRFSPILNDSLPIDIFVIRSIYLLVLAYIFGLLSEFEQKQNKKLMSLYKTAADAAAQAERHRIARELHDRMLQALATLALRLEACRKQPLRDPEELSRELKLMQEMAVHSMSDIRQFLSGKDVPSIAPGTLVESLKEEMKFLRDGLGVHVIFEHEPEEIQLAPEVERELYFALREGLMNIAKHSQASRALIVLKEAGRQITGSVEDDGIGFDSNGVKDNGTLGLRTMRERIDKLGGAFEIRSSPGKGTRISFTAPVAGG